MKNVSEGSKPPISLVVSFPMFWGSIVMRRLFSSAWRKGGKCCQIRYNKYLVNKQCQRSV